MRRLAVLGCLGALLCAGPLVATEYAAAPQPAAPTEPRSDWQAAPAESRPPLAWRQNSFAIPFRVNRPEDAADAPVEVRLYVSSDQGRNWELAQTAQPEAGRFVFRAPQDGEYWFSLRTVDRAGQVLPDKPHRGELRVAIDTAAPQLQLQGRRGEAGQVELNWQAFDPRLDPQSLRVEYQPAPGAAWKPLALTPHLPTELPTARNGDAKWWPEDRHGPVAVRAEIADQAGNRTVSQAQISLVPAPGANTAGRLPEAAPKGPIPFAQQIVPSPTTAGAEQSWPRDHLASRPFGSNWSQDAPGGTPPTAQPSSASRTPFFRVPSDSRYAAPPASPYRNVSQSGSPSASDAARAFQGIEARMVNARRFELHYDIESAGPAGIAKVELWSTRDRGQSWSLHRTDADNRSPMQVEVPDEGLYGFRIVVQASNGLGGRPPQAGDEPEVWIGVDLARPEVRLVSALPGSGNQADHLIVQWEAHDARLDPRPITLSFAPQAGAPWQTIAAGLENTGSYAWRLDPSVPDELYLRLEARDAAGNVAVYETLEPVRLFRPRPKGLIRGVRPVTR